MNISLEIEEEKNNTITQHYPTTISDFKNEFGHDNAAITNTHSNKIQQFITSQNKQLQNSTKLLMPATNKSSAVYSRDITNRITLSSLNPNHNFNPHKETKQDPQLLIHHSSHSNQYHHQHHHGNGVKRSQSIHSTTTTPHVTVAVTASTGVPSPVYYTQQSQQYGTSSYRNSFIYSNRLDIIKDDLDSSSSGPTENEHVVSSSSTSSNNDSSNTSSASVSISSSSSPSASSAIYSNVGRGFTLKKKNYDNKNLNLINSQNNKYVGL